MIRIDGKYGEGGGQILRSTIALSCLTGESVEITNIRANRPKPGLAAQHLKGIEAAKLLTDARVEGLRLGSTRIAFHPGEIKSGKFRIDIGTAGSVTLILQSILLPALVRGCELHITGGTDVKWAPPTDYVKNILLKALSKLGVKCDMEVISRGYYPKGGGKIIVVAEESSLKGFDFSECTKTANNEMKIYGISHCSNLPESVAERQANSATEFLERSGYRTEIEIEVKKSFSTGSGITLWRDYKGGSSLGEKGKRAEIVGVEAAKNILNELNMDGCFDSHLADQIMVFAAAAKGRTLYTTTRITMHQKSNAYVISKFFGDVIEMERGSIKIDGSGII
jgi:RNA 3'-terminal phosphate cyclase (ATP)